MTFFKTRAVFSWCLYDWANSALATIIFTFIFSVYFGREIVGDETRASIYWGYTIGISGLIIAILGPILGAVSDALGPRKPIVFTLTAITILSTLALFWAMPNTNYIVYSLILIGIATIGFELAQSQYNGMLGDVAPTKIIGRVSGWAWAMGYFGGLACLMIALIGFVGIGDTPNFLGLSEGDSLNIRATCLLAAIWYGVFSLPFFMYVPDRHKRKIQKNIFKKSIDDLWVTLKTMVAKSKNITWFLIASALYRDGLNTLFTVGGIYAAGTFGMEFQEILIFAIGLNVTSGIGAFLFASMDDKHGAKLIIMASLSALIGLGIGIMIVDDKTYFIILALCLGIFIGPVQASSRSMMARLSPANMSAQMFGFYAMTGKSISFLGPLLFAILTQVFENQRAGIAAIIGLWIVGFILMLKIKEA